MERRGLGLEGGWFRYGVLEEAPDTQKRKTAKDRPTFTRNEGNKSEVISEMIKKRREEEARGERKNCCSSSNSLLFCLGMEEKLER